MQNRDFWSRITSLYRSQTSPVVFACKTAWFASEWQVYRGSSPHLWLCGCKTATLGPDLQVCIGPRPHLRFWALITACLAQEQRDYIASRLHLCFCARKTATLGLELQVSVDPSPHLWFLHAKQWRLDQNNKCRCFPNMTCHFVHVQERA